MIQTFQTRARIPIHFETFHKVSNDNKTPNKNHVNNLYQRQHINVDEKNYNLFFEQFKSDKLFFFQSSGYKERIGNIFRVCCFFCLMIFVEPILTSEFKKTEREKKRAFETKHYSSRIVTKLNGLNRIA